MVQDLCETDVSQCDTISTLCETRVTPEGGMLEVKICFQQGKDDTLGQIRNLKRLLDKKLLCTSLMLSLQPLNINPQIFPTVTHKLSVLQPDLSSLRGEVQRKANLGSFFPSTVLEKLGGGKQHAWRSYPFTSASEMHISSILYIL